MKAEDIKHITEPILENLRLFLVEVKVSKDNVIEVLIDGLKGVNIQTCIEVSREIEQHLNREEEDFELTVSSAGIGYPFKVNGQYQKNLDKTVEVKLTDNTKLTGILKAYNDTGVTLECEEKKAVDGKKKKEVVKAQKDIARTDIREIRDVVKF